MHCMRISHKLASNPVTAPKSYFCKPYRSSLSATFDLRLAVSPMVLEEGLTNKLPKIRLLLENHCTAP